MDDLRKTYYYEVIGGEFHLFVAGSPHTFRTYQDMNDFVADIETDFRFVNVDLTNWHDLYKRGYFDA